VTRASVHVLDDAAHVAEVAAEILANRMLARARLRLLMPTGHTPLALYEALRRRHTAGLTQPESAEVFQLDEYRGVAAGDERSYRTYLRRELAGTGLELTHAIDANAADVGAECARYQSLLDEREIDVAVLGLGRDGHVGFDEPGSSPLSETRVVKLADTTREDAAGGFEGIEHVPREAITVGMRTLLSAREVVMLVTGAGKARTLGAALGGPVSVDVPASLLRLHSRLTILCDAAAAAELGDLRGTRSDRVLVVLGHREPGISREHRASPESFGRLRAAAEIAAAEPVRAAVITGYTSTSGLSEAEQMASEWPGDAPLLLEVAGRDTAENATRSLPLILALGGVRRVTVVTSAWHFRAVPYFKPFRDHGLRVDFQADWTRGASGFGRMLWNELRLTPRVGRTRRAVWAAARVPQWLA
jgi:glucosamine-6-phosphate deaminase